VQLGATNPQYSLLQCQGGQIRLFHYLSHLSGSSDHIYVTEFVVFWVLAPRFEIP
jgi:hypothetical protein